jgi:hypothetical protein
MSSIFSNYIAMDSFCYEVVGEWVEYRKSKTLPFTIDDFCEMMEEFEAAMEYAFEDYITNERM